MFASRGRAVWLIAALGLLLTPSVAGAADENPCNGSDLLCNRTLDQVVLPGTHNSMSAAELDWYIPNQTYSIPHQLDRGVRAMLWDTHYGEVAPGGTVKDISKDVGRTTHAQTFFCHALCTLGAVDLTTELRKVAQFLAAHPREILVTVNEDDISPEDYATAVEGSGLIDYVYRGPVDTFPTLGQMINSGQRVVMFNEREEDTLNIPWLHKAYDEAVMETPYTFPSPADGPNGGLDDPAQLEETCRPNRGIEPSPLFLMNHWVTTNGSPDINKAEAVNTRAALVARARACEQRRGKLPNILAVDMFGAGDELGAVRELNGIPDPPDPPAPPDPPVAKPFLGLTKPKAVKVRSKRKATFRVKVKNSGDGEATAVKVCASVPRRLARRPRCVTVKSIAPGTVRVVKLRLRTKKRYRRGVGSVKFMVFSNDSDQSTLGRSTRLTVKPLKKPKKHRSHKR